jgi:hypothetical protein
MATNVPYVTLNDGNKMPQVGFGLWKVDNATCADTVYNAIKAGYRLFDGACGTLTSVYLFFFFLLPVPHHWAIVSRIGACYRETGPNYRWLLYMLGSASEC